MFAHIQLVIFFLFKEWSTSLRGHFGWCSINLIGRLLLRIFLCTRGQMEGVKAKTLSQISQLFLKIWYITSDQDGLKH